MKDMRSIGVNLNTIHIFCIDITTNMAALFNNKNTFPTLFHLMRKNSTKETCTNNQIIVLRH